MAISLFIAGDVAPIGIQPEELLGRSDQIFRDIKPFISGSDFSIVNLEAPIVKGKPTPIKKSGPILGVHPSTAGILRDLGFGIFTLANNHFYDHGQKGVSSTLDECKRLDINTVGGGVSYQEARKPLFLEKEGKRIAIINACEHEFSIANNEHGGSNLLDIINMQEQISYVRDKVDFVILILHGGVEGYHYPTPRMKRWYHHFLDLGADAVINHHQHCINGFEVYKGKPIFYGLGNFYFPWGIHNMPPSWDYGYAVRLIIDDGISFELIPYNQTVKTVSIRDWNEFEKEIDIYNLAIKDDFLLQQKFDEYIISKEGALKTQLLPSFMRGKYISAIVRRGWLGKLYKGNDIYSTKNKLTCQSHHETIQRLFEILTK